MFLPLSTGYIYIYSGKTNLHRNLLVYSRKSDLNCDSSLRDGEWRGRPTWFTCFNGAGLGSPICKDLETGLHHNLHRNLQDGNHMGHTLHITGQVFGWPRTPVCILHVQTIPELLV